MILRMEKTDHKTQLVDLDSGLISYCEAGNSDQTLLLLHGFSFRQGMYPLMDSLKSNFHVVIPDLPFSTNNNFHLSHSLDSYAAFLLDFVDHLGLEKVSIFGNSVGGTLGLLCCAAAPGRFDSIVTTFMTFDV